MGFWVWPTLLAGFSEPLVVLPGWKVEVLVAVRAPVAVEATLCDQFSKPDADLLIGYVIAPGKEVGAEESRLAI